MKLLQYINFTEIEMELIPWVAQRKTTTLMVQINLPKRESFELKNKQIFWKAQDEC